jgi:hypothetical protein
VILSGQPERLPTHHKPKGQRAQSPGALLYHVGEPSGERWLPWAGWFTWPCRIRRLPFVSFPTQKGTPISKLEEDGMRFMIIVKASEATEAGVMPTEEQLAAMGAYHRELADAGVLLDGSGLKPSSRGWRVRYSGEERTITDGPFSETKELIAGYTLIQVKSREEAMEWVRRFPNPAARGTEAEIEVRQLFELEDFVQGPAIEGMREMGMGGEAGG